MVKVISRPKGTNDLLPEDIWRWQKLELLIREECAKFNYQEIRTPIFEETGLFQRGLGEATDIVEKEMYTFNDKGGRSMTLRPEGTASVVRAYVENNLKGTGLPAKLYYLGPMFRYERPQAGRYRQFHQFGIECFGSSEPSLDAEVIMLAYGIYTKLGAKNVELKLNSIGCPNCRPNYLEKLKEALKENQESLCSNCRKRSLTNPLRVLDCKEKGCQATISALPRITDYLCTDCSDHYTEVKETLTLWNVDFVEDSRLVRGLDYYTKTVFEFSVENLGAQNAVGGGGRYDKLVEEIGGEPTPAVGFAMGIERTILAVGDAWQKEPDVDLYIVIIGDTKKEALLELIRARKQGLKAEMDHLNRSVKAQFKQANRLNAKYCLILGPDEIKQGKVKLKNMRDGEEIQLTLSDWLGGIK
ncbi:MAG: histidine--tRNA ligase [Firmicutes bacterium]|nr:histidine--tRNA ligase [Bacillota bacterium]